MTEKFCKDTKIPLVTPRLARGPVTATGSRAVMPDSRLLWPNGSTLRIAFLGGSTDQQQIVREFAPQWTDFANLSFEFVTSAASADIRIGFDASDGSWSYLGTQATDFGATQQTMNFGWLDEAVVLHEFGHALGLGHEHQNPEGGLEWNEDVVIRDLSGPPNNWSPAVIRHNVLDAYARTDFLKGTVFDPASIMLYFFPDSWVKSGNGTKENTRLSGTDKAWIGGAAAYPRTGQGAVELTVTEPAWHDAAIDQAGETDLYTFVVGAAGRFRVETEGSTDVVMALFGPDEPTRKIAEDDDSGPGTNARIEATLQPGNYTVSVRHYAGTATGAYRIEVGRIG